LLGVQLSAGSIASFVKTCQQNLAEVETQRKGNSSRTSTQKRMVSLLFITCKNKIDIVDNIYQLLLTGGIPIL
jgi:hypothetical protein